MTLFLLLYTLVICMAGVAGLYLLAGLALSSYCWYRSRGHIREYSIGDFITVMAAWPFFAWSFYKMGFGL